MSLTADDVAHSVLNEASNLLDRCVIKIAHCLDQLSEEQVWWRPADSMNSIGNLILHLCGNMRQWMVAGIGGAADIRQRSAEFAERGPIPKAELLDASRKKWSPKPKRRSREHAPQTWHANA